jgi:serine/threonine protein kinase
LNLGIALRTQAQLETDRNALEEDMVELKVFRKELQNGLDTLGGQLVGIRQMIATNRPMDDILAMVEIDYRQVVSITPSETRKGRTFPVHKRSWLAQEVAEKPLGFFGSQDMLEMLKKEVAILKKLDRCNYITKFMGITNRNNQISIVMEWLPNGDLASTLAKVMGEPTLYPKSVEYG